MSLGQFDKDEAIKKLGKIAKKEYKLQLTQIKSSIDSLKSYTGNLNEDEQYFYIDVLKKYTCISETYVNNVYTHIDNDLTHPLTVAMKNVQSAIDNCNDVLEAADIIGKKYNEAIKNSLKITELAIVIESLTKKFTNKAWAYGYSWTFIFLGNSTSLLKKEEGGHQLPLNLLICSGAIRRIGLNVNSFTGKYSELVKDLFENDIDVLYSIGQADNLMNGNKLAIYSAWGNSSFNCTYIGGNYYISGSNHGGLTVPVMAPALFCM